MPLWGENSTVECKKHVYKPDGYDWSLGMEADMGNPCKDWALDVGN